MLRTKVYFKTIEKKSVTEVSLFKDDLAVCQGGNLDSRVCQTVTQDFL